jgi:hypothetical protein
MLILHFIALPKKYTGNKFRMFFEDKDQTQLQGPVIHGISKPPCVIVLVALLNKTTNLFMWAG